MTTIINGVFGLLGLAFFGAFAQDTGIMTNQVRMQNPPPWLTDSRVRKVESKVSDFLEWRLRRIQVYWDSDPAQFLKKHGWGPKIQAFYRSRDKTIHLGPKVNATNFDEIFGHELVHAIIHQKYGNSIPVWFQEGLANYVANKDSVNYQWLYKQPKRKISSLSHPQAASTSSRYHYQASLAVVEMVADKCSLSDVLQLSVGKKMETYLQNFCEISDVDRSFEEWVAFKASGKKKEPYWKKFAK